MPLQGMATILFFLAKKAGAAGQVYAFDVQEEALSATRKRLEDGNLLSRAHLIKDGHEKMGKYINEPVKAVVFNLGFLPGGNKEIITKPDSTLQALQASLSLLAEGGIITLVVYSKHKGGMEEMNVVEKYLSGFTPKTFTVAKYHFLNHHNHSPFLLAVLKAY